MPEYKKNSLRRIGFGDQKHGKEVDRKNRIAKKMCCRNDAWNLKFMKAKMPTQWQCVKALIC